MPPGKATAKAIQASINAFHKAPPEIQAAYLFDGEGTQVVLIAPDEVAMREAHAKAFERGIPCALYPESLGIGPCTRAVIEDITEGFELM